MGTEPIRTGSSRNCVSRGSARTKRRTGLADGYLAQHNAKYAVVPREAADYHLRVPPRVDLEQVFCLEEERIISSDWVVQYGRRRLQIEREQQKVRVERGATVTVRKHRDDSLSLWLGRSRLRWHELSERPAKASAVPKRRHVKPPIPSKNHPWREMVNPAQQGQSATT